MRLPFFLLVLLGASCASAPSRGEERPLSPFYDREERPTGKVTQVRPFYWKREDKHGTSINVLAPLIRYREDETFKRLQILPNIFYTERKGPPEVASRQFIFFPFLWKGNDDFILLPIGGYSNGFLGLHEFLMVTPFYMRSKRITSHPTDPVVFTSRSVLWPFISWGSDGRPDGRRKLRLWPFYGRKDTADGGRSGFIGWPFFTWTQHDEKQIRQWHLWPLYGKTVTPTLEERVILYPIYNRSEDLLTGTKSIAIWPFWRRTRGPDDPEAPWPEEVTRAWPLYEYRRVDHTTTEYFAWPFVRTTYLEETHQFGEYVWVVPFYKRIHRVSREDGYEQKKKILWPVFRKESNSAGEEELVIPPIVPVDAPNLRDMAEPLRPFISLYHVHKKANGVREGSALFGSVMTRRSPGRKHVRLLWGAVGWDREPKGRYLRLLWGIRLRLGDSE